MRDFESDCERFIDVAPFPSSAIVYESILKKQYPDADWKRLFSLIEDHIVNEESIDWPAVWKEWEVNSSQ